MTQPWGKWYYSDWRSDPCLRNCSFAARGLWMEMLCLMNEAIPCGSLLVNRKPLTTRQIAQQCGASSVAEVDELLAELEEAAVFSRDDDGTIFSRRMRRDVLKAIKDRDNGSGGGNPNLIRRDNRAAVGTVNREANGGVNPQDKAQNPESRIQKESSSVLIAREPASRPDEATMRDDDELFIMISKVLGQKASNKLRSELPIVRGWIGEGCDLERDILPELSYIVKTLKSERLHTLDTTWARDQVTSRRDRRLAVEVNHMANGGVNPPVFVRVETPQWEAWLPEYRLAHGGKSPPIAGTGGWYFPTEWPPGWRPSGAPPLSEVAAVLH